jgi:hypothetical protein
MDVPFDCAATEPEPSSDNAALSANDAPIPLKIALITPPQRPEHESDQPGFVFYGRHLGIIGTLRLSHLEGISSRRDGELPDNFNCRHNGTEDRVG